jgi:hypothetical protein
MSELSDVDKFAATPRGLGTGYYEALELARHIQRQRDDARSTIARKNEQYYALVSEKNDVIVAFEKYREKHKDQSAEIARLKAANDELAARVCDECNGDGWKENRIEGRHACVCMEEAEPYIELKADKERVDLLDSFTDGIEIRCEDGDVWLHAGGKDLSEPETSLRKAIDAISKDG